MRILPALALGLIVSAAIASQRFDGPFSGDLTHPAIEYATRPTTDPISNLNRAIQQGEVQLKHDEAQGYLKSVLSALRIPIESQMLVFSKTSFQSPRINPNNPRALYFSDSVSVGWVRGGPVVEAAAQDPRQGVVFYILDQKPTDRPQFVRHDKCLNCHESYSSLGVPGMLVKSVFPAPDGTAMYQLGSYITDDGSPFAERWGGWYVTGKSGSMRHMGNAVVTNPDKPESMIDRSTMNLDSVNGRFKTDDYLSDYSDIVALMVFEHQMHFTNLLTRFAWEVRVAQFESANHAADEMDSLLRDGARELVDALLFIDERPITSPIQGTSGFAETFAAEGPFDSKGRSLRQFDLELRLMRYPCSYMIYSEAFDGLPDAAKKDIYMRLWQILSGAETGKKYARLSLADRQAIVEILRETKKDLPGYFSGVTK